jgi:hypothetical protein
MRNGDVGRFNYAFKVLGEYEARMEGNETHVTLNVLAGRDEHLVYCGTLTMSLAEWDRLREHLQVPSETIEVEVQ